MVEIMSKPRRAKSEAAKQRAARLAAKKVRVLAKARAMLKRLETLPADEELRKMHDSLVEELFALRNTRCEVNGKHVEVLQ
jgi:vacuolar-type H+-ATPase subunit E/Vma4